jgi:hypothetical protein
MHKAGMFISEQLRHELQQRSYLIQASLPVLGLAGCELLVTRAADIACLQACQPLSCLGPCSSQPAAAVATSHLSGVAAFSAAAASAAPAAASDSTTPHALI